MSQITFGQGWNGTVAENTDFKVAATGEYCCNKFELRHLLNKIWKFLVNTVADWWMRKMSCSKKNISKKNKWSMEWWTGKNLDATRTLKEWSATQFKDLIFLTVITFLYIYLWINFTDYQKKFINLASSVREISKSGVTPLNLFMVFFEQGLK